MLITLYEQYTFSFSDSEGQYYDYINVRFNTDTRVAVAGGEQVFVSNFESGGVNDPTGNATIVTGVFYDECIGFTKWVYSYDGSGSTEVTSVSTPNSTECGYVAPDECDLVITNVAIVAESLFDAEDGSLTITATSSAPGIVYSLDNITFQSSNVFNGLYNSSYTVYVKDSGLCTAQQTVAVSLAPYGCKYQVEYVDEFGFTKFARIYKRGYVGPVIERCGGNPAVVIKMAGSDDDKFTGSKGSTCTLQIKSTSNFEYLELFNGDERESRIDVWKVVDGTEQLDWRGYILADFHTEPYDLERDYYVTITASDGIGTLKKKLYKDADGGLAKGTNTQFEAMRACLRKLNLGLPIYSGVNIYADIMLSSNDDDPFKQAIINQAVYQTNSASPYNCLDVLEENLKPYGAQIRQNEGAWHILEIASAGQSYIRRKYTNWGVFLFSEEYDPLKLITGPSNPDDEDALFFINRSQILEVRTGHEQESVFSNYAPVDNVLPNGTFPPSAFSSLTTLKDWTGTASIRPVATSLDMEYPKNADGTVSTKGNSQVKANSGVVFTNALIGGVLEPFTSFIINEEYRSGQTVIADNGAGDVIEDNNIYQSNYSYGNSRPITDAVISDGAWTKIYDHINEENYSQAVGNPTYIQSNPILFLAESGTYFTYQLEASFFVSSTRVRIADNKERTIAVTVAFEVKQGDKWLDRNGVWQDFRYVFYSLESFTGAQSSLRTITVKSLIPPPGNLVIKLYQPMMVDRLEMDAEDVTLTWKNISVKPLLNGVELSDGKSVTQEINENYSESGDVIELIHSDFPTGNNAPLFYKGGILAQTVTPYIFPYTAIYQVGGDRFTPGNSRLVGSGTSPDVSDILLGDELYIKTNGTEILQGPYTVVGFMTSNNDLVISKPKIGDTAGPAGRAIFTKTKTAIIPTRRWSRRGQEDNLPLAELLLQQVALNFSRPTQQISGVLRGRMNFINSVYDPNNPDRLFLLNGASYNAYREQWDCEFIELVVPVVVLPGLIGLAYEDGEDRILENMDLKLSENGGG